MAEAQILGEDDRVELIDGEILRMSPIGRRHAATVDRLTHLFIRRLGIVPTSARRTRSFWTSTVSQSRIWLSSTPETTSTPRVTPLPR
jgi:hypothetical protein